MTMPRDKWTAFLLSLAVPGAGQLYGRRWNGLLWLLAAWAIGAFWYESAGAAGYARWVSLALLGLCSAEHAKRQLELDAWRRAPAWPASTGTETRVQCGGGRGRSIAIEIELTLAQSASEVWRRVSDLPRFLTIDVFHERITLARREPAAGVDIVLAHNAFGRRFLRFGRILHWREGRGYAFSDLSRHGRRAGFPHVFFVSVEPLENAAVDAARPIDEFRTRLLISVRGRWTSRWIPVWIGRLWTEMVCRENARLLRRTM